MGLIINSLPEIDKIYTDHILALNDPKLRQEYQDLCFDLHLPCPSAYWTLETSIKNKIIETKRQPAGSWTRNFWNWMASTQLSLNANSTSSFGAGYLSWKDTANGILGNVNLGLCVVYDVYTYLTLNSYGYRAGVVTTFGILAGTDATAFSIENYKMGTLIANGTGAGQFSYQGMNIPTWTWTAGILTMNTNWFRYMNNNSGADITVEEIGMIGQCVINTSVFYALFERHVTGGLVVPNTAQLKCEYDIKMVYPS